MKPRHFLPAVLLLHSAVAALAGGPHPSLPPPVIPDCLGVDIHFTDPRPGEMEMLAAAGFKWVRMDFGWAGTERKRGEYDFSAYDRLVANLDQHKLRAVFILDYGNPLYAELGEKHPMTGRAGTAEFRDAFARWAVAAVSHFKGRGCLWEMWNEPNIEQFWKSSASREDYIALAKATGQALRDAKLLGEKGEAFIGPATSTIDQPFLEACFKAGLLEFWDAVSVHPYRQTAPETVEEEYRAVRLLIRKYAPKDKTIPVISGEWGYSSAWKDFDENKQAQYLPRQLLTNIANDVALSIWYDWHDDGRVTKDPEHHFGIVGNEYRAGRDPVYDAKPAYSAMMALTGQFRGLRFNKRLMVFNDRFVKMEDDHVLLFANDRDTRLALWTTDDKPHSGEIPASNGALRVVGYSDERKPAIAVSGNIFKIPLDETPQFLAPEEPNPALRLAAAWARLPLELVVNQIGEKPVFPFSIRNPLDHPILLAGYENGGPPAIPSDPSKKDWKFGWVAPGEELSIPLEAQIRSRFATPIAISEGVHLRPEKDVDFYFLQSTAAICARPLRATLLPPGDHFLLVRVDNPAGDVVSGTVQLEGLGTGASNWKAEEPFSFRSGEMEKVVKILVMPNAALAGLPVDLAISDVYTERVQPHIRLEQFSAEHLKLAADGNPKVKAIQSISDQQPPSGPCASETASTKLSYSFEGGWKFLQVKPRGDNVPSISGEPVEFGLWIYGDGAGCGTRIRFVDSSEQTFQPDGPAINWKGWRYVKFPMQGRAIEHWRGADDGKIHYPIKWDALFLLDSGSHKVSGEIFLSAPTLIYAPLPRRID